MVGVGNEEKAIGYQKKKSYLVHSFSPVALVHQSRNRRHKLYHHGSKKKRKRERSRLSSKDLEIPHGLPSLEGSSLPNSTHLQMKHL